MSIHVRPSSNSAFYERIRCAEAKIAEEVNSVNRRPRACDTRRARCMREIEVRREMIEISRISKEVWE